MHIISFRVIWALVMQYFTAVEWGWGGHCLTGVCEYDGALEQVSGVGTERSDI